MAGESLERLLAASPSLVGTLRGIERAARADTPVLIIGRPGTGRSSLARALHYASPRADGPLVEVDPGVIPATLFESDLFGYRAGAFTGAEHHTEGRVTQAEGGTLILDHVEALPLAAQAKLLRLLAERRYAPLGGRDRDANVRFVAVADADLKRRMAGGTFRPDLFYRLDVVAYHLSPLRERRDDLPTLLPYLLEDLGRRFARPAPSLSDTARQWMQDYHWPGNLRQLRNLLEREMILHQDGVLDPEPPADAVEPRPCSLAELEKEHILKALAYTRGHQGKAAELLGISRKNLWEKRKRYDIP